MIELQHLTKRFATQGGTVVALNDINLTIRDGDVYGIIGMSGAGKSTLVRCINMLERPDEGNVIVNGKQMQDLRAALDVGWLKIACTSPSSTTVPLSRMATRLQTSSTTLIWWVMMTTVMPSSRLIF